MSSNRTTTRHYDVQGIGNLRVLRILLLWKVLGLGDLGRRPRILDIVALTIRHHIGGIVAVITVKYEQQWLTFLRGFRRRKAVIVRRAGLYRDKLLGRL